MSISADSLIKSGYKETRTAYSKPIMDEDNLLYDIFVTKSDMEPYVMFRFTSGPLVQMVIETEPDTDIRRVEERFSRMYKANGCVPYHKRRKR